MNIEIAPITLADAAGFHACLDTVARERRYLAMLQAPPLERTEGFVRDSVATDAAQFVARHEGRVVGWADIFPAGHATMAHIGSLGMGLLPAYRGQGLGRRLLLACIAKAQAQGITRVGLQARADNTAALRLYASVGFEHECVLQRGMRVDGVYFDTVQMGLLVTEGLPTQEPLVSR